MINQLHVGTSRMARWHIRSTVFAVKRCNECAHQFAARAIVACSTIVIGEIHNNAQITSGAHHGRARLQT